MSKLGLSVEHLAVMGEEAEGWKGRTRIAHCHYASRTAIRFGPDIEALFWIAQLKGERVPSMVPDQALVVRAVQVGARVFVENYTLPGDDDVSEDSDIESPVKTWYPPD